MEKPRHPQVIRTWKTREIAVEKQANAPARAPRMRRGPAGKAKPTR